MLKTSQLTNNFHSYKKEPGFVGSIKSLFTRDYITKTVYSSLLSDLEFMTEKPPMSGSIVSVLWYLQSMLMKQRALTNNIEH